MSTQGQATQLVVNIERWIAEARGGSRTALEQLLGACFPYLLAMAKRELCIILQPRLDPVDVVQDTLLKAWKNFTQFRGQTETDFFAWLRQILHNNLANERREHIQSAMRSIQREVRFVKAAAMLGLDDHGTASESPDGRAQARARDEALEIAMRRLPGHYREVLHLHTQEGMTFAQVGERLHCSAEAARKLWKRAAEKLVRLLKEIRES